MKPIKLRREVDCLNGFAIDVLSRVNIEISTKSLIQHYALAYSKVVDEFIELGVEMWFQKLRNTRSDGVVALCDLVGLGFAEATVTFNINHDFRTRDAMAQHYHVEVSYDLTQEALRDIENFRRERGAEIRQRLALQAKLASIGDHHVDI
jgi:hypothetical protein